MPTYINELFIAIGHDAFGERLKLGALVEDIGQHLHEGRSCSRILVIAHGERVLESCIYIGTQKIRHGQDSVVFEWRPFLIGFGDLK